MGVSWSTVGRAMVAAALSVPALCGVAEPGSASPLDPIDRPAPAFDISASAAAPIPGIRVRFGGDGAGTFGAADGLTLRTDIVGEPGQGAGIGEASIASTFTVSGSLDQAAHAQTDQEPNPAQQERIKARNARRVLKLFARLLPSSFTGTGTDGSEYRGGRHLAPRGSSPFGYDLSLSGYPSELLVDEILVPLANMLLAPDIDESGRASFSLLGLGKFQADVPPNDLLPGGMLSFVDLTWQGHGGFSLYSDTAGFHYSRRDSRDTARKVTLKEVILSMLYELIKLPFFYISIAGVILVLAITSSKRA